MSFGLPAGRRDERAGVDEINVSIGGIFSKADAFDGQGAGGDFRVNKILHTAQAEHKNKFIHWQVQSLFLSAAYLIFEIEVYTLQVFANFATAEFCKGKYLRNPAGQWQRSISLLTLFAGQALSVCRAGAVTEYDGIFL
jgi:hypothetical protein